MVICTAFTDGSEKGHSDFAPSHQKPIRTMPSTCGELRFGKAICEQTGVIMISMKTDKQVSLGLRRQ